ncbi:MAG: adenosylcobalamin-dependent ribonucleoside-diphosphate reductase [Phycisphaerae bacterium]
MTSATLSTRTATDMTSHYPEPILTENARKVLEARYLKKNEAGDCVETPRDLFARVARTMADVELRYGSSEPERQRWEAQFYDVMTRGDFMPNSPTLMNAGREMGMLSACFVLPVRDSINDIFDSIKHTALIQKAGGGTGFAFDELRPTGDYISSSGGTTSGPITFWRAFSEATNAIQQGAFRRGANMGMMYIHHPDILKFLHAKQDLSQFTNYNISVKVTDQWMNEYIADPDSPQVVRNPRTGQAFLIPRDVEIWKYDIRSLIPFNEVEPLTEQRKAYFTTPTVTGSVPAELAGKVYTKRDVWNFIIQNAWQTGEPGVVFIDRINETNPTPHIGRMEATNPCGEQPLLPYEACNLGSINLGNFIRNECTPQASVDWDAMRECVHVSTRFLDNVIDANNYPLEQIDTICKNNRKIGLGVMGFADALYKLNVAYCSDDGVAWGERFMKFINDEAHNYSEYLAKCRGVFPNWYGSHWQTKHNRLMRNACTTTVAPTGTISIIANCSGGIEPMFSLAFFRNVLRGQKQGEKPLVEVNDTFRKVAAARGFLSPELLDRLATEGTLHHIDTVPDDIKSVFVCAHDIAPSWHMQMQAGFQRHNDSSISKTINFPNAATPGEVEQIYRLAYEMKCKGVTVYRDGCRAFQPMALKDSEKKHSEGTEARRHEGTKADGADAAAESKIQNPKSKIDGSDRASVPDAAPAVETVVVVKEVIREVIKEVIREVPVARPRNLEPADLPEIVSGLRIRQMTPFGNMHVKITVEPRAERELEVFAQLGKGGDVATSDLEAICRMISLWLRSGGSIKHVIKQLEGIGSSLQIPTKAGRIMSLGDGLACALKKYMRAKERFGLKPLLLGEIDPAQLDNPNYVAKTDSVAAPGNGGGNGGHGHTSVPSAGSGNGGHGNGGSGHAAPAPAMPAPVDVPLAGSRSGGLQGAPASGPAAPCHSSLTSDSGPTAMDQRIKASTLPPIADEPGRSTAAVANVLQAAAALANGNGNGHHDDDSAIIATETAIALIETHEDEHVDAEWTYAEATTTEIESTTTAAGSSSTRVRQTHDIAQHYKVHCPECDSGLTMEEGCRKCHSCGWAAC